MSQGVELAKIRESLELSQDDFAKMLRITSGHLSRLENSESLSPRLRRLVAITTGKELPSGELTQTIEDVLSGEAQLLQFLGEPAPDVPTLEWARRTLALIVRQWNQLNHAS